MTEVSIVELAPEDIGARAPRQVLAVIDLELTVHTDDDYVGQTVVQGFQYALKVQFARRCPELALLYDLHVQVSEPRSGSRIYDIKVAPTLKKQYRDLERDIERLEKSVEALSAEVNKTKADAKKRLMATILAVVGGLTTVLNLGITTHKFGVEWGLIPERAKEQIEANHPGTIIHVRQVAISEPPPRAEGKPSAGAG